MRPLLALTFSDLRMRVRDKSVLIFALVVPLALMFVFNLVFGGTDDFELEPITVSITAPDNDQLAGVVTTVIRSLDGQDGLQVTVRESDAEGGRAQVEDNQAAMSIVIPDGFAESVRAGDAVAVKVVRGDEAGVEADVVLSIVDGLLEQFASGTVAAQAALAEGVAPEELAALAQEASNGGPAYELTQGEAADEQLDANAALVAGQAGLFLMFTVSFGVTALLVDRETGTLARLRSMPIAPWVILTSKALVSFLLGVIATSVLLGVGGLLFGAEFGSPLAVGALVVSVCAAATSMMFLIIRIARTSEQASIATSIVAVVLGIGGGAFFPISASGGLAVMLDLNPVAALIRGLGITSAGGGLADIGAPVLIMFGFALAMLVISRLVPDRGALS